MAANGGNRPKLKHNDRVFFGGMSGSGKTTLAKVLLKEFIGLVQIIVLDPKRTFFMPGAIVCTTLQQFQQYLDEGYLFIIYRPTPPQGLTRDAIDKFFEIAWTETQDCILYIDETYTVASSSYISPYFLAFITQGRELGKGTWIGSQRPSWIPIFVYSEANHFFVFRMQTDNDIKRMAGIIGKEYMLYPPDLDRHEFYYYRPGLLKPVLCNPIRPTEGGGLDG